MGKAAHLHFDSLKENKLETSILKKRHQATLANEKEKYSKPHPVSGRQDKNVLDIGLHLALLQIHGPVRRIVQLIEIKSDQSVIRTDQLGYALP